MLWIGIESNEIDGITVMLSSAFSEEELAVSCVKNDVDSGPRT